MLRLSYTLGCGSIASALDVSKRPSCSRDSKNIEYPDPQAAYREMASTQLDGRMAKPEEIAAAALFLASDESAMVTGSALMIDGGWSAGK